MEFKKKKQKKKTSLTQSTRTIRNQNRISFYLLEIAMCLQVLIDMHWFKYT